MAGVCTGTAQEPGSRSVLLILDASGSMNARMPDGRTRFEAARAAVADMLAKLPGSVRVGLRVYGHQSKTAAKNCEDTELVAPFDEATRSRATMQERLGELHAQGYTPITLSLQRAAEDIAKEPAAERMVVLVSDGRETCNADPCAAAKALAAANAKLAVHTVGLGVDAAARSQLQCIASVARGTYYDAATSGELIQRLNQAAVTPPKSEAGAKARPATSGFLSVKGIAEFGVPIYRDGAVVGSVGTVDPRKELPPGIYSVKFANGAWTGIEIKAGETTMIEPAYLKIETPAKDNLYLLDGETGEELGGFFMEAAPLVAVVPGRYSAHTSLPFLWNDIELNAGRITTLKPALARILHRSGRAESVLYRITQLETAIEDTAVNGSDLSLPPGRYRIDDPDRPGIAVEFEVKTGDTKDVTMDR
jgi:Mg-chelatase subunit ChlD